MIAILATPLAPLSDYLCHPVLLHRSNLLELCYLLYDLQLLYAEQEQYHGVHAVDTRRHSMIRSTDNSIAEFPILNIQLTGTPTQWQGQVGTERISNDLLMSTKTFVS